MRPPQGDRHRLVVSPAAWEASERIRQARDSLVLPEPAALPPMLTDPKLAHLSLQVTEGPAPQMMTTIAFDPTGPVLTDHVRYA